MNLSKFIQLLNFFGVVRSERSVTGGITKIWSGTQAQYDALTPADDTLYIIVEA